MVCRMDEFSDRFQDEGSGPTQAERDEAELQIAKEAELREYAQETFKTIARELAAVSLLNKRDVRLGSSDSEIIEGAAEQADELFDRLLDRGALKDAEGIRDYEP